MRRACLLVFPTVVDQCRFDDRWWSVHPAHSLNKFLLSWISPRPFLSTPQSCPHIPPHPIQVRPVQSHHTNNSGPGPVLPPVASLPCPAGGAKPLSTMKTRWTQTLLRARAPQIATTIPIEHHVAVLVAPRLSLIVLSQLTTPHQASQIVRRLLYGSEVSIFPRLVY